MVELVSVENLDIWGVGLVVVVVVGVGGVIPLIHYFTGGLLYIVVTISVVNEHL